MTKTDTSKPLLPGTEIIVITDMNKMVHVRAGGPCERAHEAFLWYGHDPEGKYIHGRELLTAEGKMWARGWNTDDAKALQAQVALLR